MFGNGLLLRIIYVVHLFSLGIFFLSKLYIACDSNELNCVSQERITTDMYILYIDTFLMFFFVFTLVSFFEHSKNGIPVGTAVNVHPLNN